MSLYDLFKHVFTLKGIDPLVDHLLNKWETSLNSTLSKIKPEYEEEAINNLSILIKVLEEYREMSSNPSCLRNKKYLQKVTDILTNSFLDYNVPVMISSLMGYLIKIPYEDTLDFIINAGSEIRYCYSYNYFGLPHEIGHLIFHIRGNISMLQSISLQLCNVTRKKVVELGLDSDRVPAILNSSWSQWVNELTADVFALSVLGPSYVYFWKQLEHQDTMMAKKPSNPNLGCERYPPENLRTNWMLRKLNLGLVRKQYDFQEEKRSSDLVPKIRKYKTNKVYDMEDEFWSNHQITDSEKEKWRASIFNESMFEVIMKIADDILQKANVDISLEGLRESINILKAEKKLQCNPLISFAALLEVRAYNLSKGNPKNIDDLVY